MISTGRRLIEAFIISLAVVFGLMPDPTRRTPVRVKTNHFDL